MLQGAMAVAFARAPCTPSLVPAKTKGTPSKKKIKKGQKKKEYPEKIAEARGHEQAPRRLSKEEGPPNCNRDGQHKQLSAVAKWTQAQKK